MKTDAQIQKDVMEELRWEPILNSAEIGVAVHKGVVTLSGTVDAYSKKLAAERAATRVSGTKAIAEDIEVKIFSSLKKNDTEIAEAVANALKWNSSVPEEKIKIKVENGWVTLEGDVEWEFQKNSARSAVENLNGVCGISNLIKIKPGVSMKEVKQKIVSAFQRNASLDSNRISVETVGDKVILKGKVRSLAEKNDAEEAVWSAPGVSRVQNELEVSYEEAVMVL